MFWIPSRLHIFVLGQEPHRSEEAATKVDFKQGGTADFLDALNLVLQRKEWERSVAPKKSLNVSVYVPHVSQMLFQQFP